MIFKQWKQVLDGTKTQTRRPVKEGDYYSPPPFDCVMGTTWVTANQTEPRLKWQVGHTYAVQPPGKKAVGRTPPLRAIRRERLGDISATDCIAEGILVQEGDSGVPGPGFKWVGLGYRDIVTGNYHVNIPPVVAAGQEWSQVCVCKVGSSLAIPAWQCAYRSLWNSIHGKGAWERMKDDDVWVLDWA